MKNTALDSRYQTIHRTFGPVYDSASKILILGSFPSVKSREINFYYGHPQNRFWPLLARLLKTDIPQSIDGKRALLLERHVALWDSIESCDIIGSADSTIRNAVPVDIARVLNAAEIRAIYTNGAASARVYARYLQPITGRPAVTLPSTSPANAAWSLDRLETEWRQILTPLDE